MEFKAYIDGKFIETNEKLEIISPIDNNVAGIVQALDKSDIENAFTSARNSFKKWREIKLEDRVTIIQNFIKHMDESKEEMARIMNLEIGKKISDSIIEIERTIEYINETIKEWENNKYSSIKIGTKKANLHRVPLGVVLAISPFNYPVNLSLAKIIPALLVGNTVVFKPATNGSLIGSFMSTLFDKAGFPSGVINVVTGRGREIGDILIANKEIDMITFTGSVGVGKNIAKQTNMIPLVLELGGNDAAYVRNDADIDLAVNEIIKGAFSYAGQRCTAIKRVIVHNDIKEEFTSKLISLAKGLELEPLITLGASNYVKELNDDSINRNDKFLLEGHFDGNKVSPIIIEASKDSRVWKEEAFGPILPIIYIDDETNLFDLFNDTNFGLQNSIFTKDIEWAKKISLNIESGTININKSSSRGPDIFPFLGVKDSGFGTQGIVDALISMTRILNVVEND